MKRFILALSVLVITQKGFAQFTEIFSNTGALTLHWKKLVTPVAPAFLKGSYYFKLDDNSFIATDGTAAGTKKLEGFGDVKNISRYVATSKYLYYLVYAGGKARLNRYDPVTKAHAAVMLGKEAFTVSDEGILVFSVFENKLLVSSWLLMRGNTLSRTVTFQYAIHDADAVPTMYTLAGSTDGVGIDDGPTGLTDGEVAAMYDLKKMRGADPYKVIYVFAYKDSVKSYLLKKDYDFGKIGLVLGGLYAAGNDVLLRLEDPKKKAAQQPFVSIWRLRNKTATKLATLPEIKKEAWSSTYRSGDWLFLLNAEAVYSYNIKTGLLRTEMTLKENEVYGYIAEQDQMYINGNTAWFRIGTTGPSGTAAFRFKLLNLFTHQVSEPTLTLPWQFSSSSGLYGLGSLKYPYFSGNYFYYFGEFSNTGGQLFQQSVSGGERKKIVLPSNATDSFVQVIDVTWLNGVMVLKAEFKTKTGIVVKTFLYRLPWL